jgi:hypothetical protein
MTTFYESIKERGLKKLVSITKTPFRKKPTENPTKLTYPRQLLSAEHFDQAGGSNGAFHFNQWFGILLHFTDY